ncbi:MAG: methyl-accepting chemotaxis protein, partial [Oligoflexia bacterium]|nr:methyl-accepting chemotaxis protein [Oligoflexia bacterium]
TMLIHPEWEGQNLKDEPLVNTILKNEQKKGEFEFSGRTILYSYDPPTKKYVGYSIDKSKEVREMIREIIISNLILGLVVFALLFVVVIFITHYFNSSFEKLVGLLNMLRNGDFGLRFDDATQKLIRKDLGITNNDEFGKCFRSFGEILSILQNFSQDLRKLTVATIDGDLKIRLDEQGYCGDFRKIIAGVNRIIEVIIRPINDATKILQKVSTGDLTVKMEGEYKGDHAVVRDAINTTVQALNRIIGEVKVVVMNVDSSTKKVANTGQSLSTGAAQQAAALEQISSALRQIGGQIESNAANSSKANSLSDKVKEEAVSGNTQMSNMVTAMTDIDGSSKNISKIIKVIDEIAFQTNLLALNAAVEAARAGKHGKGFAVVAEEVRNLAARSAEAAKETTALIANSNEKVKHGSSIAATTAEALARIVSGITEVADFMRQISDASQEQSQGVSQINQGMKRIESVTQKNTSAAEETADAAGMLNGQSVQLLQLVNKFHLDEQEMSMEKFESSDILNKKSNTGSDEIAEADGATPIRKQRKIGLIPTKKVSGLG